jgi:hypothetical protein
MTPHLNHSPLCVAVLLTAALAQAPALVQAQTPATPVASAAPSASSAPAKMAAHAAPKTAAAPQRSTLDLQAPPLSHIYPREQLQYIMAIDSTEADDAQEVNVKGEKYLMPVPRSQFQAIPWALMHPTQAWRVFTPVEGP